MKLGLLTLCKVMRNELMMKTLPGAALWIYVLSHKRNTPFHILLDEVRTEVKEKESAVEGEAD